MSEKIKALPEVACFYEHDWSKYPERIKVTMSNGRVVTYRIDIPQPAPVFREKLAKFKELCVGYEKPADAATSNRLKKRINRGHDTTETEN